MKVNSIGVLLTNIGTPDAPTPKAVRRYLKEFLSDRRVVEIPRWIWMPILHGMILPARGKSSAKLYQKIWTKMGSPLLQYSQSLATALQKALPIPVTLGMHYGNPSIKSALQHLSTVEKIIVLPLYPQYSATTTASSFDRVAHSLKSVRKIPQISHIHDYADNPKYIQSISNSIQAAWNHQGKPQHLLFSFHGIPKRFADLGDPYPERCQLTAQLIAESLQLEKNFWSVTFQSRLGRAEWLTPYTDASFKTLPSQGIKHLHVVCPGFAVDCLETLEEIAIKGKKQFLQSGGESLYYIPALNDCVDHVNMIINLIEKHIGHPES